MSSLRGQCHCGAVAITLPFAPQKATNCNCSLCRRLGALWVYYDWGSVQVEAADGALREYVQGDRTLRTMRCATCGCPTHWEPLDPQPGARHGVNLRLFDAALMDAVQVRRFDGADSWTFVE